MLLQILLNLVTERNCFWEKILFYFILSMGGLHPIQKVQNYENMSTERAFAECLCLRLIGKLL